MHMKHSEVMNPRVRLALRIMYRISQGIKRAFTIMHLVQKPKQPWRDTPSRG